MTKDFSTSAVNRVRATMIVQFKTCNALGLCLAATTGQKYLTIVVVGPTQAEALLVDAFDG